MQTNITEVRMWTHSYNPFVMGGSVWNQIATVVPVLQTTTIKLEPDLTINILRVQTPSGERYVESFSGGIIGSNLDKIIRDIESADIEFMRKQIIEMKSLGDKAENITNKEFFTLYSRAK